MFDRWNSFERGKKVITLEYAHTHKHAGFLCVMIHRVILSLGQDTAAVPWRVERKIYIAETARGKVKVYNSAQKQDTSLL